MPFDFKLPANAAPSTFTVLTVATTFFRLAMI